MLETPVVLIAFNRPDVTLRNLDILRRVAPRELYLLVDGPRNDRPDDVEKCNEVRRILDSIDWDCRLVKRYAATNLGCEANVELGLDFVFANASEAIILEDDCLAEETFFAYCAELLKRYEDSSEVWHVAGHSYWVPTRIFGGDSYAFTTYAPTIGWATWSRAWKAHRARFRRLHPPSGESSSAYVRARRDPPQPRALVTRSAHRMYENAAKRAGDSDLPWDAHWTLTVAAAGGLAVLPAVNLIRHDGWGPDSSHSYSTRRPDPTEPVAFPLQHPSSVSMRVDVEREIELVLLRINGPVAQAVRRYVRSVWLRGLFRRLAHSKPAVALMRVLDSRARSRIPRHR